MFKKATKAWAKGGIATAAVGAMALASATPTMAQDRYRDRDGISAGEVIAGAVILGGIAAVAGSIGKDRYRDDRYYRNGRAGYYNGSPRSAVERCVNAVNRDARRYGYRSARVTQIRDVDDTRYGWRVKGRVEVREGRYDRRYSDRYDRRYRDSRYDDYGRYDRRHRTDDGKFTCYIERGRVADIDYSGLKRL